MSNDEYEKELESLIKEEAQKEKALDYLTKGAEAFADGKEHHAGAFNDTFLYDLFLMGFATVLKEVADIKVLDNRRSLSLARQTSKAILTMMTQAEGIKAFTKGVNGRLKELGDATCHSEVDWNYDMKIVDADGDLLSGQEAERRTEDLFDKIMKGLVKGDDDDE